MDDGEAIADSSSRERLTADNAQGLLGTIVPIVANIASSCTCSLMMHLLVLELNAFTYFGALHASYEDTHPRTS